MLRKITVLMMLCIFCIPASADEALDRIRIVIASSSDWTILKILENGKIVNTRCSDISGQPGYNWTTDTMSITQPIANAQNKKIVKAQFDIVVQSKPTEKLRFESTKGDIGVVQIDFYQFNTKEPKLIKTIENRNSAGHPNPKVFDIDANLLFEGNIEMEHPKIPPLILAFYYPWYSIDSWNSPYLADKPIKPYRSVDTSAILHHIHLAKQAGIDGFISSWWGPGDYTDQNLQKLLMLSENYDFAVSIYFETLTGDPPKGRSQSEITSWLRYFLMTYRQSKSFLRIDDKPVIFIWAAEAVPINSWRAIFNTLKSEGLDAVYIANTLNPEYLEVFDGLHDYGSAFRANIEEDFQRASAITKTYGWLSDEPKAKFWFATAQPGYDDRLIPGRSGAVIARDDGRVYERTFKASVNSKPEMILITSFNEWWETTHIEPSVNYGDLYLEITAKFSDMYKGVKLRPPRELDADTISEPDGSIYLSWKAPFAQNPDSYNIYRSMELTNDKHSMTLIKTGISQMYYVDLPPTDKKYYYAVSAIQGNVESPLSETIYSISSRSKSYARPGVEIPVDIAIYAESVSWITEAEADRQARILIELIKDKVNDVEFVSSDAMPGWVISHIKNGQPDIILTFGDFPCSIYPFGNVEPDNSLAEAFLDDGNIILNTGDYMLYAKGKNGEAGLINLMDIPVTMWGDNSNMMATKDGSAFTPSLSDFVTDRPFHLNYLKGTDWEVEISFANNRSDLADPVIVRNKKTNGRIGIIYQKADDRLPRGKVIAEIIINWLPKVLSSPWDLNFDGNIDLLDLILIAKNIGRKPSQFQIFKQDFNSDGIVNIVDLVLLAQHISR